MNKMNTETKTTQTKTRQLVEIRVALIGTPNCGKTTIFNEITGARQHVGNYPGVTVEYKSGEIIKDGYKIKFIDLPGTYSLYAYSPEEAVSRNYLINENQILY